jgi:hypothetical protein
MDAKATFDSFFADLHTAFPEFVPTVEYDLDTVVKEFEAVFNPQIIKLLQRDASLFESPCVIHSVNISDIWNAEGVTEETQQTIWKHLQMCVFASFFHGDIKEKLGTLASTFKGMWGGNGDELSKILEEEGSEDKLQDILNFVMETRIGKICAEMVEKIDISSLNLNFENPEEIMNMLKNPEHPTIRGFVSKIQNIMKEKLERGEITQELLIRDIESIKAKLQGMFGSMFNDMLGGRRAAVPATALMSNSPEARRQRMLARLKRKVNEKKSP